MTSAAISTQSTGGLPGWLQVLALGLTAVLLGYIAVAIGGRRLATRIRRDDVESGRVVSEAVAAVVNEADPELVVMRSTYQLRDLLGLDDCRWARPGDPLPVAHLGDDGTIHFGGYRWPHEDLGLPPHGVQRMLVADGHRFGWIVMVPATANPVSDARLAAARSIVDLVALSLDQHRCTVVVGPSV